MKYGAIAWLFVWPDPFSCCFVGCLMSVWELLCVRIYLRWFIIKMACFLFSFFFFGFVGTKVLSFFLPISSVLMLEQCRSMWSWWNGAVAATHEDYFRFDWDQCFSCHSMNLTCLQRRVPTLSFFETLGRTAFGSVLCNVARGAFTHIQHAAKSRICISVFQFWARVHNSCNCQGWCGE